MQESLASLSRDKRSQAQSIYDTGVSQDLAERSFQEQIRQFNENQAAQARVAAQQAQQYNFGGNLPGNSATNTPSAAKIVQDGKNINFVDGTNKPITALQYSKLNGIGFTDLLNNLAKSGDKNAQIALKYVDNNGNFKNVPVQYQGALSALGASGSFINQAQQNLSTGVTLNDRDKKGVTIQLPALLNGRY